MKWLALLLYNLLLPLALLVMLPAQWRKMRRRGGYGVAIGERLGAYSPQTLDLVRSGAPLWIHAVSVGEMLMALRLVATLRESGAWTGGVVLSVTTSTGRALAEERADAKTSVVWMPFDLPIVVGRVVRRLRPKALILVEAELWPNLVSRCHKEGIPVCLLNARLSRRSESRYRRFRAWVSPFFGMVSALGLQYESDRPRFAELGVRDEVMDVTGSIKFDGEGAGASPEVAARVREVREQLSFLGNRRILLAASTHPGEEAMVCRVWRSVRSGEGDPALVVVPRHFERAGAAAADMEREGARPLLISRWAREGGALAVEDYDCLVVDVTGVLAAWTEAADFVIVGKSFAPHYGGQTPAEAARAGKPIATGPHMENFQELVGAMEEAKGIASVSGEKELEAVLRGWIENPELAAAQGDQAHQTLMAHQGALRRSVDLIGCVIRG